MTETVVRNAAGIMTGARGAEARRSGDIRIRNGRIAEIGTIARTSDEITIDARDCVIYPGTINTHHHLFQSVLKGVAAGLDVPLAGWVHEVLFRYWHRFDERTLEIAATIGIAELLLSGTTTIADHHFLFSDDDHGAADVLFAVAARFGVRFVLARGGATQRADVTGAGLAQHAVGIARCDDRTRRRRRVALSRSGTGCDAARGVRTEYAASGR